MKISNIKGLITSKDKRDTILFFVQIFMFLIAIYAMYQTNSVIEDNKNAALKQDTIASKQDTNATKQIIASKMTVSLLTNMAFTMKGVENSMSEATKNVDMIPVQVNSIISKLKRVSELIEEYKKRVEEELNKEAVLSLTIRYNKPSLDESGKLHFMIEELVFYNSGNATTTVEQIQLSLSDYMEMGYSSGISKSTIHDTLEHVNIYHLFLHPFKVFPKDRQVQTVGLDINNPTPSIVIYYKIFHTYSPNEGKIEINFDD